MPENLSNTLSVIGVFVSIIGVVVSLLLFNASINNGRKILLNNVLNKISFELFFMFSPREDNNHKISRIDDFNRSMIKIDSMLNEVDFNNSEVPLLGWRISYDGEKATQTFQIEDAFERIKEYLKRRHISGIDVFLEYYDDRITLIQCFDEKIKYIHKFLIGPIVGISVSAIRNKDTISFNGIKKYPIPIKKIRDLHDMKVFYEKVYLKYDPFIREKTFSLERTPLDITQTVKKGEEKKPTIYL